MSSEKQGAARAQVLGTSGDQRHPVALWQELLRKPPVFVCFHVFYLSFPDLILKDQNINVLFN